MMNKYKLRQFRDSDIEDILRIYNHYVKNGFAAYSEKELDVNFFIKTIQEVISCYVLEIKMDVVGYAILRNYLPYDNFRHTGKLTYFIKAKYTHKGLCIFKKYTESQFSWETWF
ncbi:hypothetical protein LCGC14_1772960 [marine sediment metagenome]|uniref:N-acetyltransferase domain-containing protein n=1 Tax=marine sediment metagenome TaxID=412755 RepID=A0A0F9JCK7_9ZZZZ